MSVLELNPYSYTVSLNLGYSRIRGKKGKHSRGQLRSCVSRLHVSDQFPPFLFNFTEANIRMAP